MYLDTSVLVTALTREAATPDVQQWLAQQDPGQLYISEWVVTEFSSALSIKLREGQLDAEHRSRALAMFTSLAEESFATCPITASAFRTAARFADQADIGLRAGDALHLAVAGTHGATLCTLDRRLLEAAPAVAVSAQRPATA